MLPTKHRSLCQQWGFAILLVLLSTAPVGAQTYQESDGAVVEPYQCWGPATFYSHKNPPYYEYRNTGYYLWVPEILSPILSKLCRRPGSC